MKVKERDIMEENIKNLNEFLSDLEVMAIKLQNYHWNVQGKEFFVLHEKLEEYYDEIRDQLDEIAEHILDKGYEPFGTMKDFMENSKIQEAKNEKIGRQEIYSSVSQDFQTLQQKVMQIKQEAEKQSDYETSSLMDDYLRNYAKKLWMLNESMKG